MKNYKATFNLQMNISISSAASPEDAADLVTDQLDDISGVEYSIGDVYQIDEMTYEVNAKATTELTAADDDDAMGWAKTIGQFFQERDFSWIVDSVELKA